MENLVCKKIKISIFLFAASLFIYCISTKRSETYNSNLINTENKSKNFELTNRKTQEKNTPLTNYELEINLTNEMPLKTAGANFTPKLNRLQCGVVVDVKNRRVLWAKNADKIIPVASLSKMLTTLISLEHCKKGSKLKSSTKVLISKSAKNTLSSSFLENYPEKTISMEELMMSAMVHSCNDSCVSIAEAIDGDNNHFVMRMNERARNLGIKIGENYSYFYNVHGLPSMNNGISQHNKCSVNDLFRIAYELQKHEIVYSWTRKTELRLPEKSKNQILLVNTNPLIHQTGVIGLKTGYTEAAKYCLCMAYKNQESYIITILAGCESKSARKSIALEMLEWAKNEAIK